MRLLFVEAQPGSSQSLQDQLSEAGHVVVTCYDDDTNGPCKSVGCDADCPLQGHVDLAVVARPDGAPDSLFEMGAVCAERHRVPVIHVDPDDRDSVIEQVRVGAAAGKDRVEAAYAAVVRKALSERRATVEVERSPGRVHVIVGMPEKCPPVVRAAVADQARATVRRFDPFIASIDVSVVDGSTLLDVFAGVAGDALLANGQPVQITSAEPSDLERVRSFYQHLSDTSTYYRFFGIRRALPEGELHGIVTRDVPHHVTLLASIDTELVGIGEFIGGEKPDEAEVAFAVADDHHREGIATLLLERLAVVARRCGLKRFVAKTLPGNHDMQLVFRTVGLTQQSHFDGDVVDVTLDLSSLDGLEAEAAARRQHALAAAQHP